MHRPPSYIFIQPFESFKEIIFFDTKGDGIEPKEIPDELIKLIKSDNLEFIRELFFRCHSLKELEFWFKHGASLPRNAIGEAFALRAKAVVFEYLAQQGHFDFCPKGLPFMHVGDVNHLHREAFFGRVSQLDKEVKSLIDTIMQLGAKPCLQKLRRRRLIKSVFKSQLFRTVKEIDNENLNFTDCIIKTANR